MRAEEMLCVAKTYVNQTVIGMGAIKGSPCVIKSITKSGNLNTVVFEWTDLENVKHESTMLVYDGADGTDGTDGFSPTITVKTSTDNTYILTITTKDGSYDTPNLKGSGGGGGASAMADLTDVDLTGLANGNVLVYDSIAQKWEATALDIPTELSDLSDIELTSLANADVIKYDFANQKWINGKIAYSEITGTPTLGTAAAKDSTNAVTENSTDLIESGAVYTGLAAKANTADLGTAAAKDSTNAVTQSSADLVESGAVYTALADKVDKETGKGLSTNDFTDTEKQKLDNLELDDLADVDMTGITDGQILAWDDANSKFVPADNTGEEYTAGMGIDISAGNEISTEFIIYPGTKAEWGLLPTSEKIKYTHTAWNDSQSGIVDNLPTQNSDNLVKSGGVWTGLDAKADKTDLGTAAAKDSTNAVTQSSTDLVESGAVYTALGDKADKVTSATNGDFAGLDASGNLTDSGKKASDFATATALENEVVTRSTLGAHNLLNIFNSEINVSGTYTEVVNSDGTVTIGGTPTSACTIPYKATALYNGNVYDLEPSTNYVLDSGLSAISPLNIQVFTKANASGSWTKIAETTSNTSLAFTTPSSFYDVWARILVPANAVVPANTVVKPQIRLATDTDTTYQSYAPANRDLLSYKDNALLGAKNLIPNNGVGRTVGGCTITVNSDGSFTIVQNDTVSSQTFELFNDTTNPIELKAPCILSSGADLSNSQLIVTIDGTDYYAHETNATPIVPAGSLTRVRYYFNSSYTGTRRVYPMLRYAFDTDPTYVPYAMTNQQLTTFESGNITYSIQATETAMTTIKKVGKVVQCNMMAAIGEAVSAWTTFATIPEGFRPATFIQVVNNKTMYTGFNIIQISPQGTVQSATALASGERLRFTAVWLLP